MRLAPGAPAKPATLGIFTVSALTVVPSAIDGTRLGGGATPVRTPLFERYEQRPQRRTGAVRIARVDTTPRAWIGPRAAAMLSPGDHVSSRSGGQFGVA